MIIKGETAMKKISITSLIVLALFTVIVLTGCPDKPKMSASERMSLFVNTINAEDYDNVKQHTSSSADMYNTANSEFWKTNFDTYLNLTNLSVDGSSASCKGNGNVTFYFTLDDSDDKNVYRISSIKRDTQDAFFK